MKLYKTKNGVIIENDESLFEVQVQDWDNFINDDNLFKTINSLLSSGHGTKKDSLAGSFIVAPVGKQELWACGVTYLRSKVGRQEESKLSGGADFYAKVYEAERPEIFFKATANRIVGPGEKVKIRKDSSWDVPEPELTLVVTSSGKIIGYTIGNDMSSRSIEGENPLYLPQAKTYDACAAIGPCIYITEEPLNSDTMIRLEINRNNTNEFSDKISISQMKRTLQELVGYVFRECSFPYGCLIMTGTGIVPGNDFTLRSGDEIKITIDNIGTLVNTVS
ncbi:fumarylacetoacetate hydrolase family protein [Pseudobacter ginsenosidimutans]|uniref:2-dehydro-3-deoxy-D-arabinonate dehydratase n=1 Tax=Pseudobacter ginsenosidimutans TaxID=661488 RepID=A0A4Q7MDM8_9BACT|nr:fumarylacetoacetate hydrolase family protein [Pseudobacter ginsenosidimutans]QEC45204.1 2-hydroxyhepta-2,4-diene-1,7-dioate isomerase [Pseudobacter ginsenosidimutans]RZS65473.1 2-dehydro-3-deoxy-D-arabinonate dehydratase [Pseudobacter ginsenosidimutans]